MIFFKSIAMNSSNLNSRQKQGLMKLKLLQTITVFLLFLFSMVGQLLAQDKTSPWPEITNSTKPWTRWWWMGNAVDQKNIEHSLVEMSKTGLGGVEIQPIYGAKGEEKNYLDYLSADWLMMLDKTISTADSLGMQVDMTLGTGWPYGGPQVTTEHAATKLIVDTLYLKKGDKINEQLFVKEEKERESAKLMHVLAFGDDGAYLDLTTELNDGILNWKAKGTDYTIYTVYLGKTRQQVKRAAPGGAGLTVDHYSRSAFNAYVEPFNNAFANHGHKLRAIFNDSYEVYGTDFTPNFFNAFQKRRGYDLKPHLDRLWNKTDNEIGNRIRSDYRQTLSDLLLTQFDEPWTAWANNKGFKTRLQAHGSPGNLIDMYTSADIPECETFGSMPYDIKGFRREQEDIREGDADPAMLKFSSSAAHISGKPLTSSETFTWLRDHFKTALSQCKPEAEDLLLNGINHIFLHGATYSPERAAWPGWKFYASVNFNPNNTIWQDAPALFSYLTNCQSMLQAGNPDNEILLYWPVYDVWNQYLNGSLFFQFKIHSLNEWLHGTNFYETTQKLMKKGYGVDYISDAFIEKVTVEDGQLVLPGGIYKSLVVPDCRNMPLSTLRKLIELKQKGAQIIFEGLPESAPGFHQYETRNIELSELMSENSAILNTVQNLDTALNNAGISPESLVNTGLKFIRRDLNGQKIYFLVNHTSNDIHSYIPLQTKAEEVVILDPLTREYGKASTKNEAERTMVKVDIPSGGSLFLKTGKSSDLPKWHYYEANQKVYPIKGEWNLSFLKGGPSLPDDITLDKLQSWTKIGTQEEAFSGTARYDIEFEAPDIEADNWELNLGDVRESARVWLNGEFVGTLWSSPYTLKTGKLKTGKNLLTIEVTNLPANRIRAKEMRGEEWKIFHEINMVDKDYKKFDATTWHPMASGLLGDVSLIPLKLLNHN